MKALKALISGSYKTTQGDIIDFEDVTGVIPLVDDEHAFMHIKSRYAATWVKDALTSTDKKVYPERIEKVREVFLDDTDEVEANFSYVGKDIKKMDYDELQDLATAKDLRYIPLPKRISGFSLREARMRAYICYSEKVLDKIIDQNEEGFNFAKLPELVVDAGARVEASKTVTNDEVIDNEMQHHVNNKRPEADLSLDELKRIADDKGIRYHWNVGRDKLYAALYGGQ